MSRNRTLREALYDFIPEAAVEMTAAWFDRNYVVLKVSRNRATKLGDFRGAPSGMPSYISVNHNLNKYSFLITLLHEMAHAEVHLSAGRRVQPHGRAWKLAYQKLALPYLKDGIFPENIRNVFTNYLQNPAASSSTYLPLASVLKEFDTASGEVTVSMLQPGTLFVHNGGRVFKVIEKLRKRYRCLCLDNKKTYLFSPLVAISLLHDQKTGTAD